MKLDKIRQILPLVATFLFLAACGDDSSSPKKEVTILTYESVEDLPACNDDLNAKAAQIQDDYYVCYDKSWEKISEIVKGVCNIDVCGSDQEQMFVFVDDAKNVYQCHDGLWKDLEGDKISEKEYLECYADALVKQDVSDKENLKRCDVTTEGSLARVDDNLYACANNEWVSVDRLVVSEFDLPECPKNENVYVMGKMRVYQCEEDNSSSSSRPTTDDPTKVRGLCMPSQNFAKKGDEIVWKFINLGGTAVTLDWDLFDRDSITKSTSLAPKVSYTRGGSYNAKLVVNVDQPSESDDIYCSVVEVQGEPITGCECTTDGVGGIAYAGKPLSATWTVSGCQGAGPFTYEWSDGAIGTDSVAVGSTVRAGDFAPSVMVMNDDGQVMYPKCKTIEAKEPIRGDCRLDSYGYGGSYSARLSIQSITGFPRDGYSYVSYVDASVVGNGIDKIDFKMNPYYAGVEFPSLEDAYYEFHVLYEGDTVCSVSTPIECEGVYGSYHKGTPTAWSLKRIRGYDVKSYSWTFEDAAGNISRSDKANPDNSFNEYGVVSASVILNAGMENSKHVQCRGLSITPPPILNCSCDVIALMSETSDVTNGSVRYKWGVSGCETDYGNLSYEWMDEFKIIELPYTKYVPESSSSSEEVIESSSSEDIVESSSSEEIAESSSSEEPVEESSSSEEIIESSSSEEVEESSSSEEVVESSSSEEIIFVPFNPVAERPEPAVPAASENCYDFEKIGLYQPMVEVINDEGSITFVTCNFAAVQDSESPYKFMHITPGVTLGEGFYVFTGCDGSNASHYWYFDGGYSSVYLDWISASGWHRQTYDADDEPVLFVSYPIVMEIPEGETMTITNCEEY